MARRAAAQGAGSSPPSGGRPLQLRGRARANLDANRISRFGPSPEGVGLAPLQDHVIAEDRVEERQRLDRRGKCCGRGRRGLGRRLRPRRVRLRYDKEGCCCRGEYGSGDHRFTLFPRVCSARRAESAGFLRSRRARLPRNVSMYRGTEEARISKSGSPCSRLLTPNPRFPGNVPHLPASRFAFRLDQGPSAGAVDVTASTRRYD